jgi:hypothetical protein
MASNRPSSPERSAAPVPERRSYALGVGLPWVLLVVLAALGVPRVVLHDLHVSDGFLVSGVLAVAPPILWVVVVRRRRARNPVWTCVATGGLFGLLLAVTHQLLWNEAFEDEAPRLGGNLADLGEGAQEAVLRVGAFLSSTVVGLVVGALCGLVVWWLDRERPAT